METIFKFDDYKLYLKFLLNKRKQSNPRYSLRGFARDIQVSPSTLSEIMSGVKTLSYNVACKIGKNLNLNEEELQYFIDIVISQHGKHQTIRKLALDRVTAKSAAKKYNDLDVTVFEIISNWYHAAILGVIDIHRVDDSSIENLAHSIGITSDEAKNALKSLEKVGLCAKAKDGSYIKKESTFAFESDITSEALKDHHKQYLQQAVQALDTQIQPERKSSTLTLSIDEDAFETIRAKITQLRDEVKHLAATIEKPEKVYCLSMQFFNVLKKDFNHLSN